MSGFSARSKNEKEAVFSEADSLTAAQKKDVTAGMQ